MGRIRKGPFGDDKENTGGTTIMRAPTSSLRVSRPWDNNFSEPPLKRVSPNNTDSTRFASLRVEHFVDANIASRAAIFENGFDPAPRRVSELASRFETQSFATDEIRPGSIVRPWPDSPLRESNVMSPGKSHLAPGGRFTVKPTSPKITSTAIAALNSNKDDSAFMESPIKTQLGRRSVKPQILSAKPVPLVGLPIPDKNAPRSPPEKHLPTPIETRSPRRLSPPRGGIVSPVPSKPSSAPIRTPTSSTPLSPSHRCSVRRDVVASPASSRGSNRCSVRAPPVVNAGSRRESRQSMRLTPRAASRQSKRMSSRQSLLNGGAMAIPKDFPTSSSFLPFDEHRLSSAERPIGAPTSISEAPPSTDGAEVRESLDFSDPDTFDTFGSINLEEEEEEGDKCSFAEFETPEKNIGALPGLSDAASEDKPIFPEMAPYAGPPALSRKLTNQSCGEDDGDVFDVPQDLMVGTGGGKALRELQCASVTAGNELAAQVRELQSKHEANGRAMARERISRAQGELELRSRFFRRWNTRYASIVDHAYFGAVLFLFRHDSKASRQGTIALKNSKMIVLADSTVRELDGFRKNGPPSLFELKTAQRKYVFACLDDEQRGYWLDNLTSYAS